MLPGEGRRVLHSIQGPEHGSYNNAVDHEKEAARYDRKLRHCRNACGTVRQAGPTDVS